MTQPPIIRFLLADGSRLPLAQRLAQALVSALQTGRLVRGSRLPAPRVLAHDPSVSRNTVVSAYDMLVAQLRTCRFGL